MAGTVANVAGVVTGVPPVAAVPTTFTGDDGGWTFGGAYTFSNNLKLGAQYNDFRSSAFVGADTKVKTWHIGIDWMISGPHGVRAVYSPAGDVRGLAGTTMNLRPATGPSTAADMWQIRYVHMLSKLTELTLGYSRTNQQSAATGYETGDATTVQSAGEDSSAVAFGMRHTF